MIRSYALVVLDHQDKIIDRHELPLVTNPSDSGFKLSLSKVSSDLEDIITKVAQQKIPIKLNVLHHQQAYSKSYILTDWIQRYSKTAYHMALEYNDTVTVKYCEGKVTALSKTEKDEYGVLTQALEFTPVTPFFLRRENTINTQFSAVGKSYPYRYPYSYGANLVENNRIENPYILDIPIIITIDGAISNPTVDLLDEDGESYARVQFSNMTLPQGERLIINSAQRKIYRVDTDGLETDYTPEVNPRYDTFLRAQSGASTLSVNTADSSDGFRLTGGWRQYTL